MKQESIGGFIAQTYEHMGKGCRITLSFTREIPEGDKHMLTHKHD